MTTHHLLLAHISSSLLRVTVYTSGSTTTSGLNSVTQPMLCWGNRKSGGTPHADEKQKAAVHYYSQSLSEHSCRADAYVGIAVGKIGWTQLETDTRESMCSVGNPRRAEDVRKTRLPWCNALHTRCACVLYLRRILLFMGTHRGIGAQSSVNFATRCVVLCWCSERSGSACCGFVDFSNSIFVRCESFGLRNSRSERWVEIGKAQGDYPAMLDPPFWIRRIAHQSAAENTSRKWFVGKWYTLHKCVKIT